MVLYAGREIVDKDEEEYISQHFPGEHGTALDVYRFDTTPSTVTFWGLSVRNALIKSRYLSSDAIVVQFLKEKPNHSWQLCFPL